MKISISSGNTKLGICANISLPQILTCPDDVPCAKDCYAKKSWRMYPKVREAWSRNLVVYTNDPDNYFNQIHEYLNNGAFVPRIFRWHVAGDCPEQYYASKVYQTAEANPHIQFLIFTKRYEFDFGYKIPNLSVIYSAWPGLDLPKDKSRPVAYLAEDTRKPPEYWMCPGKCSDCYRCWELSKFEIPIDIVFKKH